MIRGILLSCTNRRSNLCSVSVFSALKLGLATLLLYFFLLLLLMSMCKKDDEYGDALRTRISLSLTLVHFEPSIPQNVNRTNTIIRTRYRRFMMFLLLSDQRENFGTRKMSSFPFKHGTTIVLIPRCCFFEKSTSGEPPLSMSALVEGVSSSISFALFTRSRIFLVRALLCFHFFCLRPFLHNRKSCVAYPIIIREDDDFFEVTTFFLVVIYSTSL